MGNWADSRVRSAGCPDKIFSRWSGSSSASLSGFQRPSSTHDGCLLRLHRLRRRELKVLGQGGEQLRQTAHRQPIGGRVGPGRPSLLRIASRMRSMSTRPSETPLATSRRIHKNRPSHTCWSDDCWSPTCNFSSSRNSSPRCDCDCRYVPEPATSCPNSCVFWRSFASKAGRLVSWATALRQQGLPIRRVILGGLRRLGRPARSTDS